MSDKPTTPRTDKKANSISDDLSSFKIGDWHAAYTTMRIHAEQLEVELREMQKELPAASRPESKSDENDQDEARANVEQFAITSQTTTRPRNQR